MPETTQVALTMVAVCRGNHWAMVRTGSHACGDYSTEAIRVEQQQIIKEGRGGMVRSGHAEKVKVIHDVQ